MVNFLKFLSEIDCLLNLVMWHNILCLWRDRTTTYMECQLHFYQISVGWLQQTEIWMDFYLNKLMTGYGL